MSLITDRRVAETVCMYCGKIIDLEHQAFAEIDGLHSIADVTAGNGLRVERFTGYAHIECDSVMVEYIEKGVEGARKRVRESDPAAELNQQ